MSGKLPGREWRLPMYNKRKEKFDRSLFQHVRKGHNYYINKYYWIGLAGLLKYVNID